MDAQTRVGWKFTVRRAAVLLMLVLVALSGVLGGLPAPAAAQTPSTTSLSYQGQVFNNGARFSATCSFQFALYDAATGGNAVGTTQTVDNVSVQDSYFSLQLDFGASPFGGGARYLDLAVKCPPETSFTPMTSRIPLTAVPTALSAPWSGLTGVPSNISFLSSPTACKDGQVAKWNSTASAWACSEVYAGSDTASSWNLNGNLGITPATNFLGTTDAVSMTFKVNNQTALRLSPGGASGTDTPNVIGGYSGNSVAKGVKGATIGGGGRADEHGVNTVTADYGTVGGGYNNTARAYGATVSGGITNTARAYGATVSGGITNTVNGKWATVGGGVNNTASGSDAPTVGGGGLNTASGTIATIGGGGRNTASGAVATIGGGGYNTASSDLATVSGGGYNTASGGFATIGGGGYNTASSDWATVGGGDHNTASGWDATVGGGRFNTASFWDATVGGGEGNKAVAFNATISGGQGNTASGWYATVGGGGQNIASGTVATVGGGDNNTVSGEKATVGGGSTNTVSGERATVSGGSENIVSGERATVGGGSENIVSAKRATVGGGVNNAASGEDATVGGGYTNTVSGERATVGGGSINKASGNDATVCGGERNLSSGRWATASGGYTNTVSGERATVGGGSGNKASAYGATVSGGVNNTASGWDGESTVGGGANNTASGERSTVGGGAGNAVSSYGATVGGGITNTVSGKWATVSGGSLNTASGFVATIPGGYYAAAPLFGQLAYASGGFEIQLDEKTVGNAQTSIYILRRTTTESFLTELFLNGDKNTKYQRLTLASGRTYAFSILVAAETSGGSQGAGYKIEGVIKNAGGKMSFIGTPTTTVLGEDNSSWDVQVAADDTNKALVIKAIGAASTTIRWVATVRTTEVGY